MKLGESDLNYFMGIPINYNGERMSVEVDFGDLWEASYHDVRRNTIEVEQSLLDQYDAGYHEFKVYTSYFDTSLVTFEKSIFLIIKRADFIPIIPEIIVPKLPKDVIVINSIEELDWEVITEEEAEVRAESPGPIPYVSDMSFTGELDLRFSEDIQVLDDTSLLEAE